MPKKEQIRSYEEANHFSEKLYFKELMENGSFNKEVVNTKSDDYTRNYNILHTWFQNQYEETKMQMDLASTDNEVKECQFKMLAYVILLRKTEQKYKEETNDTRLGYTKEFSNFMVKVFENFKIYDTAIESFTEKIDNLTKNSAKESYSIIEKIEKEVFDQKLKQMQEAKRKIIDARINQKKQDYLYKVQPKVELLKNFMNAKVSSTVVVDKDFIEANLNQALQMNDDKFDSIASMANDYQKNVIDLNKKAVDDKLDELKDDIGIIENDVFNEDKEVKEIKDEDHRDIYQCAVETMTSARNLVKDQMTMYMAAKHIREDRWLITKIFNAIFRPAREKAEKDKIAELRNNLKHSLQADDKYMDDLDKYIEGKLDKNSLEEKQSKVSFFKFDYQDKLNERLEEIENVELNKELGEKTNSVEISNSKDYQKDIENNIELDQSIQQDDIKID